MSQKKTVLFLCATNACRSQMAEGWTRHLHGDRVDPRSAGVKKTRVDPNAVRVMAEAGVDIAGQRSKQIADLPELDVDLAVTVCASAREHCPAFPGGTRVVHVAFDDPPTLAEDAGTEDEALAHYRRVRDEIRAFVEGELPRLLWEDDALSGGQAD
ncbi:MAG: arsenate reductase ArsC, partial [Planctomycetota bacterium]